MRVLLLFLTITLSCLPLSAQSAETVAEKARCEVCGMFVAPYPHWLALIELNDGQRFYFDGPKDLFIFFSDMPTYRPGLSVDQVKQVLVTEYYRATLMPATEVFFVADSDVLGPMGVELVPVAGRKAADTFLRDHGGSKLVRFDGHKLHDLVEQP